MGNFLDPAARTVKIGDLEGSLKAVLRELKLEGKILYQKTVVGIGVTHKRPEIIIGSAKERETAKLVVDEKEGGERIDLLVMADGAHAETAQLLGIERLALAEKLFEAVNDQLKNISQVEQTRHRSPANFLINLLGGIAAYCYQPKKPSLRFGKAGFGLFYGSLKNSKLRLISSQGKRMHGKNRVSLSLQKFNLV